MSSLLLLANVQKTEEDDLHQNVSSLPLFGGEETPCFSSTLIDALKEIIKTFLMQKLILKVNGMDFK